jgi:hypothetical protein
MTKFRSYKELKEITMEVSQTGHKRCNILVLQKKRKNPIFRAIRDAHNFLDLFQ